MNEKLNIQDLVNLLAEKHGMSQEHADSFVREFFQLIEEALEKDQYVKIKGLGTFKLINVESRESVNINTGERFEIKEHTKVSFLPETALKDIINKPFLHFETVVLNEGTVLEDTPYENEEDEEMQEMKAAGEVETSSLGTSELVEDSVSEPVRERELMEEKTVENQPDPVFEIESDSDSEPNGMQEVPTGSSTMKYFVSVILLAVIVCGGAVFFMYAPDWWSVQSSQPTAEIVPDLPLETEIDPLVTLSDSNAISQVQDTIVVESMADNKPSEAVVPTEKTAQKPVTAQSASKKEKKHAVASLKADSVGYAIVGTETVYTIKEGETLTKVSLRFYGTKALWPYLVKHNPKVIKNPDNVPWGTAIKIPKLEKRR